MHEERVTDDVAERLRLAADTSHLPGRDDWCVGVLPAFLIEVADEIERLQAERDRWRKIADDFYEAGSNRPDHSEVADAYENEARSD